MRVGGGTFPPFLPRRFCDQVEALIVEWGSVMSRRQSGLTRALAAFPIARTKREHTAATNLELESAGLPPEGISVDASSDAT
jgi:hypothetical protein